MKDKHSGVTDTNNEANAVRDATKLASRAKEPRMKVLKSGDSAAVQSTEIFHIGGTSFK